MQTFAVAPLKKKKKKSEHQGPCSSWLPFLNLTTVAKNINKSVLSFSCWSGTENRWLLDHSFLVPISRKTINHKGFDSHYLRYQPIFATFPPVWLLPVAWPLFKAEETERERLQLILISGQVFLLPSHRRNVGVVVSFSKKMKINSSGNIFSEHPFNWTTFLDFFRTIFLFHMLRSYIDIISCYLYSD